MRFLRFAATLTLAVVLVMPTMLTTPAAAAPVGFNDPNFKIVWERTDKPVDQLGVARSYMWGPNTLPASPSVELYADSPGGQRTVQYFDKSRMEVNDPNGDRSNLFFVTNGLLVREMVGGRLQKGNNSFLAKSPSLQAVAGDPADVNPNCPTYSSFRGVASLNNDNSVQSRIGTPVNDAIDISGDVTKISSPDPSVVYASYDPNLKHNIPNKMYDFLNQSGAVWDGDRLVQQQVINPIFLAGLPITEAYWVKAKVNGVEKDVLVQLYERRALTYTPSNPAGWQVEMGNVGQHYLRWRYGGGPVAPERIVFQSMRDGKSQLFSMLTNSFELKQLTSAGNNVSPRWSGDNQKIVFVSDRDGNQEVYTMNADGSNQQRLTVTPGIQESDPEWNADASRIYYVGDGDIWQMNATGGEVSQVTNTPAKEAQPRVSPDSNKVAFATDKDGQFEVYTMNHGGTDQLRLTNRPGIDSKPTDWKGNSILFNTVDDNNIAQIWRMDGQGGGQTKLSGDKDFGSGYSPDMKRIVFSSEISTNIGSNVKIENADGTSWVLATPEVAVLNSIPDWTN